MGSAANGYNPVEPLGKIMRCRAMRRRRAQLKMDAVEEKAACPRLEVEKVEKVDGVEEKAACPRLEVEKVEKVACPRLEVDKVEFAALSATSECWSRVTFCTECSPVTPCTVCSPVSLCTQL